MQNDTITVGLPLNQPTGKFKKKKRSLRQTFLLSFVSSVIGFLLTGIFLLYGPISYFRVTWVTIAMSTLNHQWMATMLFDQKTISAILASNKTVEPNQSTNPLEILSGKGSVKDNATTLPSSPEDGEHIINGIGFIKLKGSTYNGWMIKVYDPSRVTLGVSKYLGTRGERVSDMAKRTGSFVAVNAGGFVDVGGQGLGGLADGICIADGVRVRYSSNKASPHSIIGIDSKSRLVLGKFTNYQIQEKNLLSAVEFKPLLIVNGEAAKLYGNGGWGTDPRTAIGQTKSGVMLFLIIDGRRVSSLGATMKDVQDIMLEYGAYNAANLDGGSSSTLVVKNQVINNPSSSGGERYVPNAFLIRYR
ncbi:MAG TPA: phosphodiester glycosidase family protein [Clostridia bacterium]|nr:phosphodiester glycosidase family protein [Clostridia bacterium]